MTSYMEDLYKIIREKVLPMWKVEMEVPNSMIFLFSFLSHHHLTSGVIQVKCFLVNCYSVMLRISECCKCETLFKTVFGRLAEKVIENEKLWHHLHSSGSQPFLNLYAQIEWISHIHKKWINFHMGSKAFWNIPIHTKQVNLAL